jgi:hypothetical protein
MIKNIFIAMDDTNAAKFENEFDLADNAYSPSDQLTTGAFRATDMTRDGKTVYSIVTDDPSIKEFKSKMGDFVHPLMTELNNLSVHNTNALFNVYRLLVPTDYQQIVLSTKAGGETSQKLQEIFSGPNYTESVYEYKPNGLTNAKTATVYDAFSISIKADDFSLNTLDRLDAFRTFMDQTVTKLNDGEAADASTTQRILTEKLGTDWANFYNVANDHIAGAPYKYLGHGVAEYGVFTDDGIQTLPRAWFDQHITNDTRHLIADSFDGFSLTEERAYSAMAGDGVDRSEIEALISSNPESDTSYTNQAVRYLSGESDDILRGVISGFQNSTRIFEVEVTLSDGTSTQVEVFVDTTTGFVATNSDVPENNQKAITSLQKSMPGKSSADYSELYNELQDLIVSYGYKMDYYEKQ